jgi:hypothetical protein
MHADLAQNLQPKVTQVGNIACEKSLYLLQIIGFLCLAACFPVVRHLAGRQVGT